MAGQQRSLDSSRLSKSKRRRKGGKREAEGEGGASLPTDGQGAKKRTASSGRRIWDSARGEDRGLGCWKPSAMKMEAVRQDGEK